MHLSLLLLPALLRSSLAYTALSPESLAALPPPTDADFNPETGSILAPILIPRVPGTPGSDAVLTHFTNFFTTHLPHWNLAFHNSTSTTPTSGGKPVAFRNLIATRDPPSTANSPSSVSRLTLAAHYDSKLTPEGFIGATDSAAPCAMLLHIARALDPALTAKWSSSTTDEDDLDDFDDPPQGLQILLLDGEEAFHSWTATDSLYGARALAADWSSPDPAGLPLAAYRTPLASVNLFVLLDLLGAAAPRVPSYFKTTHWAYNHLADVEATMREAKLLESSPPSPFLSERNKSDTDRWLGGLVEDDHIPFLKRGVEVLHLIPHPFPKVWHTMADDGKALDSESVRDWTRVVGGFVGGWLGVEGFVEDGQKGRPDGGAEMVERDELQAER